MKKTWEKTPELSCLLETLESNRLIPKTICLILVNDEEGTLKLTGEEAQKVLANPEAVEEMYGALDRPYDCTVEISGGELPEEVLEKLEELFDYVEEV
jgi:hypothetical protein